MITKIERKYLPIGIDAEFKRDEYASLLIILGKAEYELDLEQKEKKPAVKQRFAVLNDSEPLFCCI